LTIILKSQSKLSQDNNFDEWVGKVRMQNFTLKIVTVKTNFNTTILLQDMKP